MNTDFVVGILFGVGALLGGTAFYFIWKGKNLGSATSNSELQEKISVSPQEPQEPASAVKSPVLAPPQVSLEQALAPTKKNFFDRIKSVFGGVSKEWEESRDGLEEVLYTSDLGPKAVQHLMDVLESEGAKSKNLDFETIKNRIRAELLGILSATNPETMKIENLLVQNGYKTSIWLVVGVNGAGKTTTVGKLAHAYAKSGKKVMIAAGDTFRAAAASQLKVWSDRAQVEIFSPEGVDSPSAVAFDAVQKSITGGYDLVIIDTAGRLHTQKNLMEELKKVKRVIEKAMPGAPHETFIVLDSNSGQNALIQAQQFQEALGLTGAVLTKLDGTAKGGVAIGLAHELKIPIRMIGVGESIDDLRPFSPQEFVDSIFS